MVVLTARQASDRRGPLSLYHLWLSTRRHVMTPSNPDLVDAQARLVTAKLIARVDAARHDAAVIVAETQHLISQSRELREHSQEVRRQMGISDN
jgi:hypothetical protein